MTLIFHITSAADWQRAQSEGSYRANSLTTEGFIHCSTQAQIVRTANKYYAGQTGLVLLCIHEEAVRAEVRYEDFNAGDLFPHIYGPIPLEAVIRVVNFPPGAEGKFTLPAEIAAL
jgi:uncharacterized protein (DUF952 family)